MFSLLRLIMGKVEIGIYFCVTADILTKVLLKCFWCSPLPTTWILSKSLFLIGGHSNRKTKLSKNKKKVKKKKEKITLKNLEAGVLDVDNHTKPWRGTFISIGWYIHSFSPLPVNGCRGTTDNFKILSSEADQLESDQLDLLWHVAIHCFLQVFENRVNRIYVVVIKVKHKYGKPFDNLF